MSRICSHHASSRCRGEVLYVTAPGMGHAKTRPCLVLGASDSDVVLLPLSSDTWNPKLNPSLYFNEGLSFAVLDRTFTLPRQSVAEASKREISARAVTTCIESLRSCVVSGQLKLPARVQQAVFGAAACFNRQRSHSQPDLQAWNNRS
jgi:hypothetical protein